MNQIAEIETGSRRVNLHAGSTNTSVSSQWFSRPDDQRFTSLDELRAAVKGAYDESRAMVYDRKDLRAEAAFAEPSSFDETKALNLVLPTGERVEPTHWSFGQTASLVKAPASYLRRLPAQIVEDNLNYALMTSAEELLKAYYRTDGSAELRAVTGPDYGRIPDYEVVEAVQRFAGNGTGDARWKVPGVMDWGSGVYDPDVPVTKATTTLFASDRDIFLFLVDDKHPIEVGKLPNGDPDLMFRGFYVWNSEVGSRSCGIATMYLRAICCNRILWGVEDFQEITMRHSKHAPDRFVGEAMPALESYAEGSAQRLVDGVAAAKAAKVASDEDDALAWLRTRGMSRSASKRVLEIVEAEEQRPARSVWDMAQGVTALARESGKQDQRIDLEKTAGRWLDKVAA